MTRWLIALTVALAAGGFAPPAMAQGENLGYRLSVLEEQVRQLVGQIQELQHQLRQIEARGGGGGMDRNQSAFNAPQQRPPNLFPGNAPPPAGQPLPGNARDAAEPGQRPVQLVPERRLRARSPKEQAFENGNRVSTSGRRGMRFTGNASQFVGVSNHVAIPGGAFEDKFEETE